MASKAGTRLCVTYELACAERQAALRAREIAVEQTVELPEGTFGEEIEREVVGRVESIDAIRESCTRVIISYDARTVGGEIPQLLNLLFGNISLKKGIRIAAVDWPDALLREVPGPRWGVDGLRRLCRVESRRPLLCTALKPMGLSARQLADRCRDFARGGIDLIKDDHGLADQESARFEERVHRCVEAVVEAGGGSLYFPNITAGFSEIERRAELARQLGCRGVLISPLLVGADTVRRVVERHGLAVLAHPALAGAFFHPDHGIAPELLLGQIFRMLGSDGVIYPNAGGRFPFDEATCAAINANLRSPLGSLRPAFPVPAGGIDLARVPEWIRVYGPDTIFLIGGSLYAQRNLVEASRAFREAVTGAG